MAEAGFTKGPWGAEPLDGFWRIDAPMFEGATRATIDIADVWGVGDESQQAANARLIAAAPDLYEALKRAEFRVRFVMDVGEPHEYSEWVELHDQIEAALLKAEGK